MRPAPRGRDTSWREICGGTRAWRAEQSKEKERIGSGSDTPDTLNKGAALCRMPCADEKVLSLVPAGARASLQRARAWGGVAAG